MSENLEQNASYFFIGLSVQSIKLQPSRTETENNFAYLLE